MCTWDLIDGQCIESVKLPQIHSYIQVKYSQHELQTVLNIFIIFQSYPVSGSEDARLFCIGNYPEIVVIDPFTLEVILTLSSKVYPDWISAIHVLRPARRQGSLFINSSFVSQY